MSENNIYLFNIFNDFFYWNEGFLGIFLGEIESLFYSSIYCIDIYTIFLASK